MRKLGAIAIFASLLLTPLGYGQDAHNPKSAEVNPPAHPATTAQIREYLTLSGIVAGTREQISENIAATQAKSPMPPDVLSDVKTEMGRLDIVTLYVPIYQRYFSEQEMQSVLDYYRSSGYKKMTQFSPAISSEIQDLMTKKSIEAMKVVYAKHKDEIDAARKKNTVGK